MKIHHKIIIFLNSILAIGTVWSAYSQQRQADAYISSLQNKTKEITKNIDNNKVKLNIKDDLVDSIIVDRVNYDLIFSVLNARIECYELAEYEVYSNPNARNTLKLIKKELDKYFFNREDNQDVYLLIWAKGFADGAQVPYGTFFTGNSIFETVEYYYEDDIYFQNVKTVDFIKGHTRMINEYYAVLRAHYIVKDLQEEYPNTYKNQIKIIAKEFKEKGPQYRGCDIQIAVKNAFKKSYDELGWGARKFIDWGWVK